MGGNKEDSGQSEGELEGKKTKEACRYIRGTGVHSGTIHGLRWGIISIKRIQVWLELRSDEMTIWEVKSRCFGDSVFWRPCQMRDREMFKENTVYRPSRQDWRSNNTHRTED